MHDFLNVWRVRASARRVHRRPRCPPMSRPAEGEAQAAAREIARYLRAHPEAADTLEGAARWWMSWQPDPDVMERAMTILESQQMVEKHVLPGGTAIFRSGPRLDTAGDMP